MVLLNVDIISMFGVAVNHLVLHPRGYVAPCQSRSEGTQGYAHQFFQRKLWHVGLVRITNVDWSERSALKERFFKKRHYTALGSSCEVLRLGIWELYTSLKLS